MRCGAESRSGAGRSTRQTLPSVSQVFCAPTQVVPLRLEPVPLTIYVDGERLESSAPEHLKLRADQPHVLFFKREGYQPAQVVLRSIDREGSPRVGRVGLDMAAELAAASGIDEVDRQVHETPFAAQQFQQVLHTEHVEPPGERRVELAGAKGAAALAVQHGAKTMALKEPAEAVVVVDIDAHDAGPVQPAVRRGALDCRRQA